MRLALALASLLLASRASPPSVFDGNPAADPAAILTLPAGGGWPEVRVTILTPGLLRISVGLEDPTDVLADLHQALAD